MDKNAKELIQKMAGVKTALSPETVGSALGKRIHRPNPGGPSHPSGGVYDRYSDSLSPAGQSTMNRAYEAQRKAGPAAASSPTPASIPAPAWKSASMKNIIDDLIKGAQHNSFGRPVSIQQGSDPTPLDLAKFAGQLQALGEQGYSVKQAAEYLGLTERQVQDIVATVR